MRKRSKAFGAILASRQLRGRQGAVLIRCLWALWVLAAIATVAIAVLPSRNGVPV